MLGEGDLRRPRDLHPAFYGSYDWHSSVHGHWMLARLVRVVPSLPERGVIHSLFDDTLRPENIAVEAEYIKQRPTFERTYGWAWLLELARELRATRWEIALRPLVDVIIAGFRQFLPKQTYPIRTGTHSNTAFALSLALDYADTMDHRELQSVVTERAMTYYIGDSDAPVGWEPGGEDFFSPTLMEADLMRRVLPREQFSGWLHRFLPVLPKHLRTPALVTDRTDPKLAHLDGLNLSRAWCMRSLAQVLPDGHILRAPMADAAVEHTRAGLANVSTGHYSGEHWLASFAVYMLGTP